MVEAHPHPELEENIEELATAVLGPRKSEFVGGGRYDDQGLVHQVDEVLTMLNNGGLKIKLPVSVWVAVIAALGALAVQLVDTLSRA